MGEHKANTMMHEFQQIVLQSEVALAIFRNPVADSFALCDLSVSIAPIADLVTREDFVGVIGLVGLTPRVAFAVELSDREYKSILHTFLDLMERAFVRVESSLSGLDENFLNRLRNLPQMPTEEN